MSHPAPFLIPVLTSLLAVSTFAPAALAATPVNETRPLDARGHLHVENLKGRIEVRAWDRNEVRITGSLGQGVEKLDISGDTRRLSVKVKYPRTSERGFFSGNDRSEPSQLQLMVPLQANLDIDSVSADVDVSGVAPAELAVDSVSGDISAVGAPRQARIDSVSGDQKLILNSQQVDTESVSGDIHLRGRLGDRVSVETVSGDIDVAGHQSSLNKLTGSTVSGDMSLATGLNRGGQISLESVSGDITLRMPRTLSATVRGESFSGDLEAPGATINRPRHGPGASFEHRYGSGDGEIKVETFSGDARLQLE